MLLASRECVSTIPEQVRPYLCLLGWNASTPASAERHHVFVGGYAEPRAKRVAIVQRPHGLPRRDHDPVRGKRARKTSERERERADESSLHASVLIKGENEVEGVYPDLVSRPLKSQKHEGHLRSCFLTILCRVSTSEHHTCPGTLCVCGTTWE
jgi:hypothetical protein